MADAVLTRSSRNTVARFAIKVVASLVLSQIGEIGKQVGFDGWVCLYALCCAIVAVLRRDRFPTKEFNHWDEALWLVALASGHHTVQRLLF